MLTISANAVAKILDLTQAGQGLRIELRPGGCCGTHYYFTPDRPGPGDLVLPAGAATIIMTPAVAEMVRGAQLDYGARLVPPRFRILKNPNTPLKCPCGRSFGAPWPGKTTPRCQAYTPMPWDQ